MSTTSKRPKINEDSKNYVESLKTTDDLYRDHNQYIIEVNKVNDIRKKRFVKEIAFEGDNFIDEIEEKYRKEEEDKISKIEYIYDETNEKYGTLKELNNLSSTEIITIYNKVLNSKKSFFRKLIDLFYKTERKTHPSFYVDGM